MAHWLFTLLERGPQGSVTTWGRIEAIALNDLARLVASVLAPDTPVVIRRERGIRLIEIPLYPGHRLRSDTGPTGETRWQRLSGRRLTPGGPGRFSNTVGNRSSHSASY